MTTRQTILTIEQQTEKAEIEQWFLNNKEALPSSVTIKYERQTKLRTSLGLEPRPQIRSVYIQGFEFTSEKIVRIARFRISRYIKRAFEAFKLDSSLQNLQIESPWDITRPFLLSSEIKEIEEYVDARHLKRQTQLVSDFLANPGITPKLILKFKPFQTPPEVSLLSLDGYIFQPNQWKMGHLISYAEFFQQSTERIRTQWINRINKFFQNPELKGTYFKETLRTPNPSLKIEEKPGTLESLDDWLHKAFFSKESDRFLFEETLAEIEKRQRAENFQAEIITTIQEYSKKIKEVFEINAKFKKPRNLTAQYVDNLSKSLENIQYVLEYTDDPNFFYEMHICLEAGKLIRQALQYQKSSQKTIFSSELVMAVLKAEIPDKPYRLYVLTFGNIDLKTAITLSGVLDEAQALELQAAECLIALTA